ncbi:GntR family transcriptional regulator [Gudongella sp. DL1XJH-153]|uniref:GntR family transcriptional regulator n=1 Tax=Gudongella sp. DL1XJH-153 TaxID=3409804 RepID=UPI003BB49F40
MKHLGLKAKAYQLIKDRLLKGEIKPGERIREDLLAESISMSRTPVREAINQLSAEGFVIQVPRKGVFAKEFTLEELADIVDVRIILETYAIRRCCDSATEADIKELEGILSKIIEAVDKDDPGRFGMYDGIFHKQIGSISENKQAISFINHVEDLSVYSRKMEIFSDYRYIVATSIDQHQEIIDALKSKNKERAANAVEINIREALKRLNSYV